MIFIEQVLSQFLIGQSLGFVMGKAQGYPQEHLALIPVSLWYLVPVSRGSELGNVLGFPPVSSWQKKDSRFLEKPGV
jgi:hypothetical protein